MFSGKNTHEDHLICLAAARTNSGSKVCCLKRWLRMRFASLSRRSRRRRRVAHEGIRGGMPPTKKPRRSTARPGGGHASARCQLFGGVGFSLAPRLRLGVGCARLCLAGMGDEGVSINLQVDALSTMEAEPPSGIPNRSLGTRSGEMNQRVTRDSLSRCQAPPGCGVRMDFL